MRVFTSWLLAIAILLVSLPPAYAEPLDYAIPDGRFFKQANGQGGAGAGGFAVYDDAIPFWSEFQRLGGVATLGYPISRRFLWDGFVVQAYQKAILQWQPGRGMFFVNVFDRLSAADKDAWLDTVRQTPPSFDNSADAGLPWEDVVERHVALLDVNPAIKAMYFADADPIQHYGLPMSYKDYGNVFVVRAQRAVFQQWKVDTPWARVGQVVIANGGDVAKEAGVLPLVATAPQMPWNTVLQNLIAGPGAPGRLYLLERRWRDGDDSSETIVRLSISDDLGKTWEPFAGGLPVEGKCLNYLTMDYATSDALYLATCRGLYRWTGAQWENLSSQQTYWVGVAFGEPKNIWAITSWPLTLIRSADGGRTWSASGLSLEIVTQSVALDPRDARRLYALTAYKGWWFSLWRGTGESGQWTELPLPFEPVAVRGMSLVGGTGEIYLATQHHVSLRNQLWRTTNPDALDAREVRWEPIQEFEPGVNVRVLASSSGSGRGWLFAAFELPPGLGVPGTWQGNQWSGGNAPVLARSSDGGKTWEPMALY